MEHRVPTPVSYWIVFLLAADPAQAQRFRPRKRHVHGIVQRVDGSYHRCRYRNAWSEHRQELPPGKRRWRKLNLRTSPPSSLLPGPYLG